MSHSHVSLPNSASSIAVLPLTNLTADADNEYFCVGLAEELVHALSRVAKLKVAAATSAFSFKGKAVEIREIRKTLNVEMVLEGSIRRSNDRMRITVQLVNTRDGYQVWSERYDRALSKTFEVKSDIALAVIKALKVTLDDRERSALAAPYTKNSKAHQLYLRGRFHLGTLTGEGFSIGVDYLNQAIAADPNYALAYAGLAEAQRHVSTIHVRPAQSLMQVRAAAEKALALDDNLAEAQALLAVVTANYDRLPDEAERRFKRALQLAPNSVLTRRLYGSYLMTQGRLAAAIAEFCRARELDPLSPILNVLTSIAYFFAREPHHALKHARRALATDESFWLGHWSAALAHEQFGQLIEALGELERASDSGSSPWITALRARVYAKLGKREIARAMLHDGGKRASAEWVAPYLVATVYFALGEIDQGFQWLETAFDDFDENLNFIAVDPILDPLRSDPRYIELLDRAGLENSFAKTHFVVPVSGDCRSAKLV